MVTDGEADVGQDPKKVVDATRSTPVIVQTVGFCIGTKHSLNRPGITVYQEASDTASLAAALDKVLAE
jgi:hypothetical protein